MFINTIFQSLNILYTIKNQKNHIIKSNHSKNLKQLKLLKPKDNIWFDNKTNQYYQYKKIKYIKNNQNYTVEIYQNITTYLHTLDFTTQLLTKQTVFDHINIYIKEAIKKEETFVIAMLDIDFFKKINDQYGHLAGDEVLKKIGKCLIKNTNKKSIIGRFGGEEFIILFKNTTKKQANKKLNNIRKQIQKLQIKYQKIKIHPITISIGATCYILNHKDIQIKQLKKSLIKEADQALYQSKKKGRNLVTFYNPSIEE